MWKPRVNNCPGILEFTTPLHVPYVADQQRHKACHAAMESFFSSLKTERTARKTYRTRDAARADVFDYIERFYNTKRRHSTIGYKSPMEFERQAGLA